MQLCAERIVERALRQMRRGSEEFEMSVTERKSEVDSKSGSPDGVNA